MFENETLTVKVHVLYINDVTTHSWINTKVKKAKLKVQKLTTKYLTRDNRNCGNIMAAISISGIMQLPVVSAATSLNRATSKIWT